ncbi:MAG: response regulator transcription factor [Chloroflexota bacterium]
MALQTDLAATSEAVRSSDAGGELMADVRVAVIDDHWLTAQGTAEILDRQPGIRSVGFAFGIDDGIALIRDTTPDVVICDVMLGDRPSGLDLAERLVKAKVPLPAILFFSYFARSLGPRVSAVGGAGIVDKSISPEDLREAVLAVSSGGEVPERLRRPKAPKPVDGPRPPSPREVEIMSLIADGSSSAQVAHELGIGDSTVDEHLDRMFKRYQVNNRAHLVVFAERHGWLGGANQRDSISPAGRIQNENGGHRLR